MAIDVDFRTF